MGWQEGAEAPTATASTAMGSQAAPLQPSAYCQMRQSWAGLIWTGDGRGPRASGRDRPSMGVARKGHSLWDLALDLGSVPSFFPWRQGKKSRGSRRPRSTQCFIEKSQAQLGQLHSTWLDEGLCPQEPEPGLPAGRPSSAPPLTVPPPRFF